MTKFAATAMLIWAGNVDYRHSTTGYVFFLFQNAAISWGTRKQKTVVVSSTKSEFMSSLGSAIQESVWLKRIGAEISAERSRCMKLFCDNKGGRGKL